MSTPNPCREYQYETKRFLLRQVKKADAPALLKCYADPAAMALMNEDNCTGGFLFQTLEEMEKAIHFWNHDIFDYIRPSVIDKSTGEPIGTLEVFGGDTGVLRMDLRRDYETPEVLRELYALAIERFPADFPMEALVTKAVPEAAARRAVLTEMGFSGPESFREYGDYYRLPVRKLGIAYCGLACRLCSENRGCPGCQGAESPCFQTCEVFPCVRGKGLSGCWECPDFPCGKGMHGSNPRARAFVQFAKEYGTEKLLACLERNLSAGIFYHYPGQLTGDYDGLTPEEVFGLLWNG